VGYLILFVGVGVMHEKGSMGVTGGGLEIWVIVKGLFA
jgi:hypothetical protein